MKYAINAEGEDSAGWGEDIGRKPAGSSGADIGRPKRPKGAHLNQSSAVVGGFFVNL